DGAADGLVRVRFTHVCSPQCRKRKKWKPLQWPPVTALATAERVEYEMPAYSKESAQTLTSIACPLYLRTNVVPGVGKRGSRPLTFVASFAAGACRGGDRRRSASLASSRARRRARCERSPSVSACRRQAIRRTNQDRLPLGDFSPKSSA